MNLEVTLGERAYPIEIGVDLLAASSILSAAVSGRQVLLVTDSNVAALHAQSLERRLDALAARRLTVVLPAGEANKNWPTLEPIFNAMLAARFDRSCLLIALGGGVVGDMTGFAAAIYQRGVDFIQIPTTLLAMVDSSVGGKTGINHPAGKNMLGAFHQPRAVIADLQLLATLPRRELAAGMAEVIKHGAIADCDYLAAIERDLERLRRCDPSAMAPIVRRSCAIKAQVVAADEREGGLRAILNFGHTFGHAIEAGMGYGAWLHGEAVAAGMVMAADLSCRVDGLGRDEFDRLCQLIAAADLPVKPPEWSLERWLELMSTDKKAQLGTPKFVRLPRLGAAVVGRVPPASLAQTIAVSSAGAQR
jgi:3-dehydroquinate synthase